MYALRYRDTEGLYTCEKKNGIWTSVWASDGYGCECGDINGVKG